MSGFRTLKSDVMRRTILNPDFFAEDITLIDDQGTETTVTAKPSSERTEQRQTEYGTELVVTRDFFLELDPDVLINTRVTVVCGDTHYAIEEIVKDSSSVFATLKTKRVAPSEKSRENYRKRSP